PGATAYRNPTLAEAMKTLGFMQRFGIGIQTARNALAANGNPPPEFDIQDTFFCVTIHQQNEQP
ncbi:MAG: transcriptional regulator, partial [Gemmatimonadetes bacterium]|nr:transcriptional regulator [Gemmatimonadota bacterium]